MLQALSLEEVMTVGYLLGERSMDPELKREIELNREKTEAVARQLGKLQGGMQVLNVQLSTLKNDVGEKHLQNRKDIHEIRDVAQTTGDKVWLAIHNMQLNEAKEKGKWAIISALAIAALEVMKMAVEHYWK